MWFSLINPQQLENPVLIERQWSKRSVNRILKSGLRCGRSSSEHKVLDTRQAKPEKETICFRIATSLVIPYEAYRASACVRISNQKVSRFDIFQNILKQISTWYFEMLGLFLFTEVTTSDILAWSHHKIGDRCVII